MASVMIKQTCVINAFALVSILCLGISTESKAIVAEGKQQVRPLSPVMANDHMSAKFPMSQNNVHEKELLNLENTIDLSSLPEKVDANDATWCIVKPSTGLAALDEIIEYCCSESGVDCGVINLGGACYSPSNKVSDASVVMNAYYQFNGRKPHDCYFNGYGLITSQDPSVDPCKYYA